MNHLPSFAFFRDRLRDIGFLTGFPVVTIVDQVQLLYNSFLLQFSSLARAAQDGLDSFLNLLHSILVDVSVSGLAEVHDKLLLGCCVLPDYHVDRPDVLSDGVQRHSRVGVSFSTNCSLGKVDEVPVLFTGLEGEESAQDFDDRRITVVERDLVKPGRGSAAAVIHFYQIHRVFYPQGNLSQCSVVAKSRLGLTEKFKASLCGEDLLFLASLNWPLIDAFSPDLSEALESDLLFDDMIEAMPPLKRAAYRQTRLRLAKLAPLKVDVRDSLFVKREALAKMKFRLVTSGAREQMFFLANVLHSVVEALVDEPLYFYLPNFLLRFSYGTTMNGRAKGLWRTICAREPNFAHLIVGGDDSLFILPGGKICFEADVSACDQSHNQVAVKAFLLILESMGLGGDVLTRLEGLYLKPVANLKTRVQFRKPQLHTGHPHTSVANTLLITAVFLMAFRRFVPEEHWLKNLKACSELFGMDWKLEEKPAFQGTFHKGYFVSDKDEYLWSPLPSRVWKLTKVVNTSGPRFDFLAQMADNCHAIRYECLSPMLRIVVENLGRRSFHKVLPSFDFDRFRPIAQIVDFVGDGLEESHARFFEARYLLSYDECVRFIHLLADWDGPVIAKDSFLTRLVWRDYVFELAEYKELISLEGS